MYKRQVNKAYKQEEKVMYKNLKIQERLKKCFTVVALLASIAGVIGAIMMLIISCVFLFASMFLKFFYFFKNMNNLHNFILLIPPFSRCV